MDRFAILLDGEFVRKRLQHILRRFPTCRDVVGVTRRIKATASLENASLYRTFYYSADPLDSRTTHPLDRTAIDFRRSRGYAASARLISELDAESDFAVRRGVLTHQGWELGQAAIRRLLSGGPPVVSPGDVVPKIHQKGVDMRIGLDIASLALKRLVKTVILVTGDSDLVPAMKFARREGLRVYLDTLGSRTVRDELKVHADRVL